MGAVNGYTVFDQLKRVVVRRQKGEYLYYNPQTDELHLVPPTGHAAYTMCDGVRTVDEIANVLISKCEAPPEQLRQRLQQFFCDLEARGLVERSDG